MHDHSTMTHAPACDGRVSFSRSRITGKERDSETGLDYFGARYLGSNMGRFTSPDEPFYDPDLTNPQKLNLYSYAGNNPLNAVDPDGHMYVVCTKDEHGKETCVQMSNQEYYNATKQNNPGITAPKFGQSGDIKCGDQVCGSARYYDEGYVNPEGEAYLAGWAIGKTTGAVLGWAGGKIMGWLGRGAGETAGEVGGKVGSGAGRATVEEILEGTTKGPVSSSRQFFKPGGMPQATADFQQLVGEGNVTTYGQVKVATLPDGSKAILRGYSAQGSPTLEIQPPAGKAIKVRYQ